MKICSLGNSQKFLASSLICFLIFGMVSPAFAVTPAFVNTVTVANYDTQDTQTAVTTVTQANVTEVKASRTLTVSTVPASGETITIGTCIVTFLSIPGSPPLQGDDELDCTGGATVDLTTGPSNNLRGVNSLAGRLRNLTNVSDTVHGPLNTTGPLGNTAIFTTTNTESSATDISFTDGTAGNITSTSNTPSVPAVAKTSTLTIANVEVGDTFTASFNGGNNVTVTAMTTSANDVATALNADIQAHPLYPTAPFTSSVAADTITFTAKTAGTSFTQTSSTTNGPDTAQEVTFTPLDVVKGLEFKSSINGNNYTYGPTTVGTTISNITAQLATDMTGVDATCVNNTTHITCTANTAGRPFTYSSSVDDVAAPVITLNGSNPMDTSFGVPYIESGATCVDNVDSSCTVNISGTVDTNTISSGPVYYDAVDTALNNALQVIRTVNVIDTNIPVITLTGSANLTIAQNSVYIDAGATASDNVDGNITGNIVVVNPVNTSVLGTYVVTYDVSDAALNAATQVSRTVEVTDQTAPLLSEITPVPTPGTNSTPSYTFSSNDAGTITYGGGCTSATTIAVLGNNTITLDTLVDGTYSTCTITVTDSATIPNTSIPLTLSSFTIDTTSPTLTEVLAVTTPTTDTTPSYSFSSTEAGTITYGGSCSSVTTAAVLGSNSVTFTTLGYGTYSDCTITITDTTGHASNILPVPAFEVMAVVPNTVIVNSLSATWGHLQENATGTGGYAMPPATPPLGTGAFEMNVTATGGYYLGAGLYSGLLLSDIIDLSYSTYRSTVDAGNNLAIALQLNVDYDKNDAHTAWQGRLIFEPYNGAGGTVLQDTWQNWDATSGVWWQSGNAFVGGSNVGKACTQAIPCSWATVLSTYPNIAITSAVGFKAGSNWGVPFTGYIDAFNITTAGFDTTYNFEYDITDPVISETTPVVTPATDPTPSYTFTSDEVGTITYGGSCTSATTAAVAGANTITFSSLAVGTYSDCTITVTDGATNESNVLPVSSFQIIAVVPNTIIVNSLSAVWAHGQENATATGSYATAPTPPGGTGAFQMNTSAAGGYYLGAGLYSSTLLSDLTGLSYSTYRSTVDAGNNLAIALQLNVDYDNTDATTSWQGRLVFEPYEGIGGNVMQDTWQNWDAMLGKWWQSGNAIVGNANVGKACTQALPCTWSTVLATFPHIAITSAVGFKAGSGWSVPFTGYIDAFNIVGPGFHTTYNFESDIIDPVLSETTAVATPHNDSTPDYTFTSDEAGTIAYAGGCTSTTTAVIAGANTITLGSLVDGTYSTCTITVMDVSGNDSTLPISTFSIDTVSPSVTINQSLTQTDPTSNASVNFTAELSEAVQPATFDCSDVSVTNGACTSVSSVSATEFTVTVAASASGVVTMSVLAGGVLDIAGNTNTASTSTDSSVIYNTPINTGGGVILPQFIVQNSPTNLSPVVTPPSMPSSPQNSQNANTDATPPSSPSESSNSDTTTTDNTNPILPNKATETPQRTNTNNNTSSNYTPPSSPSSTQILGETPKGENAPNTLSEVPPILETTSDTQTIQASEDVGGGQPADEKNMIAWMLLGLLALLNGWWFFAARMKGK